MGDDHELAVIEETLQHRGEAVDVGFVERRVQLIEHAEGRRFDLVNREQEGHGRHGLLAAREQRNALELLARRPRHNIDACLEHILALSQLEIGATTAEHLGEHGLEVGSDLLEGLNEETLGLGVDAVDHFHQLALGLHQIIVLSLEEGMPLFGFLVLLDGHQVDRTNVIHLPLKGLNLGRHGVPIGRPALLIHDIHGHDLDLRQPIVGRQDAQSFGPDLFQGHLVLFLNARP